MHGRLSGMWFHDGSDFAPGQHPPRATQAKPRDFLLEAGAATLRAKLNRRVVDGMD
jgi:hypothetical protein